MEKRLKLQTLLELKLGSKNVYFQPPANIQMKYPCIVYSLTNIKEERANDNLYNHYKQWQVTYIDRNPDSLVPGMIHRLPMCSFERNFTSDNLNHTVFNMYY